MRFSYNNRLLMNIGIFLLVFRIFFTTVGYFSIGYPMVEMGVFMIIILSSRMNRFKMEISTKERFVWLIFVFYITMTSIFSIETIGSIRFSLLYLFIILSAMALDSIGGWQYVYTKMYLKFSVLFCLTTYLSYFFGHKFINMISFFYTSNQVSRLNLMYSRNYFSGISNQVGFAGFFISIGVLILFSKNINEQKKSSILKIALMLGGVILTAKRGHLVAVLLSLFIMKLIMLKKSKQRMITKTAKASIVALVIAFISYSIFEPLQYIVSRFLDNPDFTSGRVDIYRILLELFYERPVFGNGFNSFNRYMDTYFGIAVDGHNIYLQLLAEVGIVGTVLIIFIFIRSLYKSVNLYLNESDNSINSYLLLSIGIQVFFLLYGLVGNPIYNHQFFMTYMYSISITFMNQNGLQKKAKL